MTSKSDLRGKWIFFCVFHAMHFCLLPLQAQQLSFAHLSVEDGLSSNAVLAIAQDDMGFMWFGTRNGLNRYDGYKFKAYLNEETTGRGQFANHVTCLSSDRRGTLWVGTRAGLNRYNAEKDTFELINQESVPDAPVVNCLLEDKKGTIWVGTETGLCYLTDQLELSPPVHPTPVLSLFEDNEAVFWIGTKGGLIKRTLKHQNYVYEKIKSCDDHLIPLGNSPVTTITQDSNQNLWVGTATAGIYLYDREKDDFFQFAYSSPHEKGLIHNNVREIHVDPRGRLWIGTQQGLSIVDPVTKQTLSFQYDPQHRNSLSQNSVHSIYGDKSGAVWIGTYFGGVNMTHPFATDFAVLRNGIPGNSLSNNVVSAMAEDKDGNLWIGTEGGGLNHFNRHTGRFVYYQNAPDRPASLSSNLVKSLYLDGSGNLWIGTNAGGIDRLDTGTGQFTHYSNNPGTGGEVVAMLEDRSGRLWMGSAGGLSFFQKEENGADGAIAKAPPVYKLNHSSIKSLFEDKAGNLWIGTINGLHVVDGKTQDIRVFLQDPKSKGSLRSDHINCIVQDHKGAIWVGTYYGGLSKYNIASQNFTTYTTADGLPDNNVTGILEDDQGDLWISTANGLSRFNEDRQTFKNYTADDGLAGNEFNYNSFFKDHEGKLFFGGYKGLTSFFPSHITTNNHTAPVVFTSLKLFNQPVRIDSEDGLLTKNVTLADHISFRYKQDVFTIDFALLNFVKPGKNRYAYKLEGLDIGWAETSTPSITYMHLPPGNYTLLVKGANNDGVWSREPARMNITILPPFWKTWWAYAGYVLLLTAILFFIIRYFFLRALLKKENELHQAKLNFFTNISHEIRTHLALITGPVERLLIKQHPHPGSVSNELNYIKKNSDSLLQLVDELMDFRKAESGHLQLNVAANDLVPFAKGIYDSFGSLSYSAGIATTFAASSERIILFFDTQQMEKVMFNLLSNAFKFTPKGGNVDVRIEEKKSTVEIKVMDNGRGIAPENLERLFLNYFQENDYGKQNTGYGIGLALSKSIVELHKGTLSVESHISHGYIANRTCFTICLLKGGEHFTEQQLRPVSTGNGAYTIAPLPAAQVSALPGLANQAESSQNTVLIVEDNTEVRAFLRESLASRYRVEESINGLAGWECATELIPDLIICDVMMPEMDGFTLCGRLKLDERTSHIPVIMLTAKNSTASQVSGLEMGADVYMSKPFSIQVLLLHLRNLLAARETMRRKYSASIMHTEASDGQRAASAPTANPIDEAFLLRMTQTVEDRIDDPQLTVDTICEEVAMSRSVLYKKLRAVTGMSVNDFIKAIRLKKAAELLRQGHFKVNEVAYMVGFSDRKYFSKEFKKQFGVTPSDYA